jgi:capsular exopolysaccharide synthesis family protein
VLIIVSGFLNDRIRDKRDLERIADLKVIATVSSFPKASRVPVDTKVPSMLIETFRFLVINLRQLFDLEQNKVIGISSSQQGEGKTFCAMNTARVFASIGKKTLYVDADLVKINKENTFEETVLDREGYGNLTDFLSNDIALDRIIKSTPFSDLYVITGGYDELGNLIASNENRLDRLFHHLKNEFDVIIVDTPPLNVVSYYFALTKYFDINLLVVRYNRTARRLLEETMPSIGLKRLKNVGLVFNDVSLSKLKEYGFTPYKQQNTRSAMSAVSQALNLAVTKTLKLPLLLTIVGVFSTW